MQIIQRAWIVLMLGYFSYWDIRTRKLPARALLLFLAAGIPVLISRIVETGWMEGFSLLPGVFFWLISRISCGDLGMGDAWMVLGMGLYLSWQEMLVSLILSTFLSMIWAGSLFLKRRDGKETLPLLPFLLAGYIGGMYFWSI